MAGDQLTIGEWQTLAYLKQKADQGQAVLSQMQEAEMAVNAFQSFYAGIREKYAMADGDTITDAAISRVTVPQSLTAIE